MLLVKKKAAEHVAAASLHAKPQGMTHQTISATSRKFSTMKHGGRLACQVEGLRTLDLCNRLDGHWQRLPEARVLVFRRRRVRCIRREREIWRLKHHGHGVKGQCFNRCNPLSCLLNPFGESPSPSSISQIQVTAKIPDTQLNFPRPTIPRHIPLSHTLANPLVLSSKHGGIKEGSSAVHSRLSA